MVSSAAKSRRERFSPDAFQRMTSGSSSRGRPKSRLATTSTVNVGAMNPVATPIVIRVNTVPVNNPVPR